MSIDGRTPWPFGVDGKRKDAAELRAVGAEAEKPQTDSKRVVNEDVKASVAVPVESVVAPVEKKRLPIRRRKMTDADVHMIDDLHAQGLSIQEIARRVDRVPSLVYRVINRLKNAEPADQAGQMEASDNVQQPAPAGVVAGEPVLPLVRNGNGVLVDGYPHVLAEFLKNSMLISELYDKPEVLISRLVASEIIRVLGGGHEQL